MTDAQGCKYYPQYCFHLSPTLGAWCPLRAADIEKLVFRQGFEGQNVFFHLNHPVSWVRIMGVVVAIDEVYGRRIFTVDDSSGFCVECTIEISKTVGNEPQQKQHVAVKDDSGSKAGQPAPVLPEIDVGMVVDVKGSLKAFRDQKQVVIQKALRVRSTDQEVRFWNKIKDFRKDVLDQPWVLEPRQVRKCRKEAQSEGSDERKPTRNGHDARSAARSGQHTRLERSHRLDERSKPKKDEQAKRNKQAKASLEVDYSVLGL